MADTPISYVHSTSMADTTCTRRQGVLPQQPRRQPGGKRQLAADAPAPGSCRERETRLYCHTPSDHLRYCSCTVRTSEARPGHPGRRLPVAPSPPVVVSREAFGDSGIWGVEVHLSSVPRVTRTCSSDVAHTHNRSIVIAPLYTSEVCYPYTLRATSLRSVIPLIVIKRAPAVSTVRYNRPETDPTKCIDLWHA